MTFPTIKWNRVDNWLAKLFAFVIVALGIFWMVYAVRDHYQMKATDWEWTPFVVSGLFIMFALAILSKSATAAAAQIILPFVDRLRLGKSGTTTTIIPAQPATPASVVQTTVTPLPEPPKEGEKGES